MNPAFPFGHLPPPPPPPPPHPLPLPPAAVASLLATSRGREAADTAALEAAVRTARESLAATMVAVHAAISAAAAEDGSVRVRREAGGGGGGAEGRAVVVVSGFSGGGGRLLGWRPRMGRGCGSGGGICGRSAGVRRRWRSWSTLFEASANRGLTVPRRYPAGRVSWRLTAALFDGACALCIFILAPPPPARCPPIFQPAASAATTATVRAAVEALRAATVAALTASTSRGGSRATADTSVALATGEGVPALRRRRDSLAAAVRERNGAMWALVESLRQVHRDIVSLSLG